MKRIWLILIIISTWSCSNRNSFRGISAKSDLDTSCIKELNRAQLELDKGQLTYCEYVGNLAPKFLRQEKELRNELSKYDISFRNEGYSCIVYESQTRHCYCRVMNKEIEEQYGLSFIDSLKSKADKLFYDKHKGDTLNFWQYDIDAEAPYELTNKYNNPFSEVESKLSYPKGYKSRTNSDSSAFVDIGVYADATGGAQIMGFWFVFDIKENHKYEVQIKKGIIKHFIYSDWKPALLMGHKVRSHRSLRFALK